MRTIFNKTTREELIHRINILDENNTALWGKMDIHQMFKHCIIWEEMALGRVQLKRGFLGFIFGRMVLKSFVKSDKPMDKNVPASPEMVVKEKVNSNIAEAKKKWISLIEEYPHLSDHSIVHPFFGKMTKEQVGILAFKHTDHHLRQFNG